MATGKVYSFCLGENKIGFWNMKKALCLAAALFIFTGCATCVTGVWQTVPVDSNPQGAKVSVSSGQEGVTPCAFKLQRDRAHILKIDYQAYKTKQIVLKKVISAAVLGNLISFGILGAVIDSLNGAAFKLSPEEVYVDFAKPEASAT
jgi:hypothetical protein